MSQRTKLEIKRSLRRLLEEKSLNKITIADITNDCGINRMTFYYHFKDIYELVEWSCLYDISETLRDIKTHDSWQQGFEAIFETFLADKNFVKRVSKSIVSEQIIKLMSDYIFNILFGVMEEKSAGMDVREEDKRFIASFYRHAFVGIVLEWINDGMNQDPQIIIEKIRLVVEGNFTKALSAYRLDKPRQVV